jgi:formiminoglutamase
MADDKRLGSYIAIHERDDIKVSMIGFPSDVGVQINGGRPGASKAPDLIFDRLMQLTPHSLNADEHIRLLRRTRSPEILSCSGDVASDQAKLGSLVKMDLNNDVIPVIAGGGHETAFGHYLGYAIAGRPVHILNIDAHTDVRDLKDKNPHSGSPFRQALEDESGLCKSYTVFGLQPSSVAFEHLEYVRKTGSAVFAGDFRMETLKEYFKGISGESVMVTMDMDTVDQSQAPGVSAPNASGIDSSLWLEIALYCGMQPHVTSFDLCEVNPEYDRDGQTVRLAALTIWYFLLGVALR